MLRELHLLTALLLLLQPLLFLLGWQNESAHSRRSSAKQIIDKSPRPSSHKTRRPTSFCAASTFLCHINCCRLASVLFMDSASFDSAALYSFGSLMSRRLGTMAVSLVAVPIFGKKNMVSC